MHGTVSGTDGVHVVQNGQRPRHLAAARTTNKPVTWIENIDASILLPQADSLPGQCYRSFCTKSRGKVMLALPLATLQVLSHHNPQRRAASTGDNADHLHNAPTSFGTYGITTTYFLLPPNL